MSSNNFTVAPLRSTPEQRTAAAARNSGRFGDRPPSTRFFEEAQCEGPGCENVIPAGYYPAQRKRSFCSDACRNRDFATGYVVGKCKFCGNDILGRRDQDGIKQFCSEEHRINFVRERMLGPTGHFRPLIEEYMQVEAKNHYKPRTLPTVQTSVTKFFRFAARIGIKDVNEIRPRTISRFIAHESERGMLCRTYVGHLSTFFSWLFDEGRYQHPNPVIPRRHYSYDGRRDPRPYTDRELQSIWELVEATGKLDPMLAFVIGQECGLRVGEVANIRLEDVDRTAQKIFVRLPTKNNRTRSVPFHDMVRKYLDLWLSQRNPYCPTDHLLHNKSLNPYNQNQLDAWFKKVLRSHPEPAASFNFHRLRHTWATRLMNNGMELAALKELGGWVSWNSMQRYIKVLDSTVQAQYEAAYKRLRFTPDPSEDEEFSLMDFALMKQTVAATPADSAA